VLVMNRPFGLRSMRLLLRKCE